ncbi:hypothetical protein KDN24_06675 [Bacillus sp. Bva_UNVM-123]|uniref:hypothetical protein n=1 Tax=Bacillus sp. Bva_UNVM-123 TaxID=2829798 RepID=UPI00391FAB46
MNKTNRINPLGRISDILSSSGYGENLRLGHVTYNENVNSSYDYQIIRSLEHDGTLLFTQNLIDEVLFPIIKKQSYSKNTITEAQLKTVTDINYTIGDIILESEYGVKVKHFNGMRDTATLPVRVEYVFS